MQLHVADHVTNHQILQKLNKNLAIRLQLNHAVNQKAILLVLKVRKDLLTLTSLTTITVKAQALAQNRKPKAAAKRKLKKAQPKKAQLKKAPLKKKLLRNNFISMITKPHLSVAFFI